MKGLTVHKKALEDMMKTADNSKAVIVDTSQGVVVKARIVSTNTVPNITFNKS